MFSNCTYNVFAPKGVNVFVAVAAQTILRDVHVIGQTESKHSSTESIESNEPKIQIYTLEKHLGTRGHYHTAITFVAFQLVPVQKHHVNSRDAGKLKAIRGRKRIYQTFMWE